MIKVLHIVTRVDSGGISTLIQNYYSSMNHDKVRFDIVAIDTGYKQGCHEDFENMDMRVYYMPEKILNRFFYLIKLMRKEKYHVVHCHIELQSAFYLSIAALCGIRVRVSHAHLSRENLGLKNKLLRIVLNGVATMRLGASDLSINAVYGDKSANSAFVLNNAVRASDFEFKSDIRDKYREELGIIDRFVVGFVGRFSHQKNPLFLIDIFVEILKREDNSLLLIVGDGELRAQMEAKIQQLEIQDLVMFLNTRKDINYLMMAMDVMLLPSLYEGLPLVLVEAQAASLKCFVSKNVTQLINISDFIHYLSIDTSALAKWAEEVLAAGKSYERKSNLELITQNHFNIEYEVQKLMTYYNPSIKN